jgi:HEAT repeat protein
MRGGTILLAVSIGAAACRREEAAPPPASSPGVPRELRALHPHPRLYERDTADLLPALLEKMEGTWGGEVLHWARARLADSGERALEGIRSRFSLAYGRAENAPLLMNLCEVLGLMRNPAGLGPLREALTHPNGGVRERAYEGIAAIGAPEAVADLGVVFDLDTLPVHRRACLRAIAAAQSEEAAGFLRALLANSALPLFHRDAVALLAAFPEPLARPALVEALGWKDRAVRLSAAMGLARFGDEAALDSLLEFASSELPGERAVGAAGLGVARRLDRLALLARDPVWTVRAAAAAAVGIATGTEPDRGAGRLPWMAPPSPPWPEGKEAGAEVLRSLLEDEEPEVRREAVRRLCGLGERGVLLRFVGAVDSSVEAKWREALEILVDPQVRGIEGVPAILARLERTEGAGRRPFLQALGHLRDPRGTDVLVREMRTGGNTPLDEGTTADYAGLMLANLGEVALPHLRAALAQGGDPSLRMRAVRAATFMPLPAAGDFLLEVAAREGEDPLLRAIAIRAAPKIAGPRAAAILKRALYAETDPRIREVLNCVLYDYF